MKTKNIIIAIIAIVTIGSLSSCSTTEQCWAYKSCSSVKAKHSKGSVGYARNHKQKRSRGGSYGCYSFNGN